MAGSPMPPGFGLVRRRWFLRAPEVFRMAALSVTLRVVGSSVLAAAALWGFETRHQTGTYHWDLPPGFPTPRVPPDNPMSEAKVRLGRYFFYGQRLSVE